MLLPERFLNFLKAHNIDPAVYNDKYPHVKYLHSMGKILLDPGMSSVEVLPGLYRIVDPNLKPSVYKAGDVLSIDLWSALTIYLLDPKPEEHFLDLCCAPGTKLILASKLGFASVTGVDISKDRLNTAVSMVKRHKVALVRLFLADGRSFSEGPLETIHSLRQKPMSQAHVFYSSSPYRKSPCRPTNTLYDKVLVDSQCTHDGSIKHVMKNINNGWVNFPWDQLENLPSLYRLQFDLLSNGWRLLKEGGILVYSTCSLCKEQNEDIVSRFLNLNPDAQPLDFFTPDNALRSNSGMLRIEPCIQDVDRSTGFFIARFLKIKLTNRDQN